MSTQAFGTRRVTESLKAIGDYLDEGVRIAEGVPPGEILELKLEKTPSTPSPRLTTVLWQPLGSPTLPFPKDGDQSIEVNGRNLKHVTRFTLVEAAHGKPFFEAKDVKGDGKGESFTATIVLKKPSAGAYDAELVSETGQTFLLESACFIKEPPGTTEPYDSKTGDPSQPIQKSTK